MKKQSTAKKRNSTARLNAIMARLSTIDEGREIAKFLSDNNINIRLSDTRRSAASSLFGIKKIENKKFIYTKMEIVLASRLNDNNLLQALIHESQHIRHHLNNLGNPDRLLGQKDHQLFRAIQEADAQATAVDVCFKLKLSGDDGPFLKTGQVGYQNMCRAYEDAYQKDCKSAFNGAAKRAAFNAWFSKPSRVAFYDRDTVKNHDPFIKRLCMKSANHNLKKGRLTRSWVRAIGALSQPNYLALKNHPPVISQARLLINDARRKAAIK